jgi:two-component system OmpR family response regulator
MPGRVLCADDDSILRQFIAIGLKEIGCVVAETNSLTGLLEMARQGGFDLWVLDRKMADGDCLDALRALRKEGLMTPALMLTGLGDLNQRVEGFEAGADDYLTKPFSIVELTARVRALLRRPAALLPQMLTFGPLKLNLDTGRAVVGHFEIALTANELRLLRLLAASPGVAFSRERIRTAVGIEDNADVVAVDHMISRVRRKLKDCGAADWVRTVRGVGFCWAAPP